MKKKQDYLELLGKIVENELTLDEFIMLNGVDRTAVEEELKKIIPITQTLSIESKPIFFFTCADYPHLGHLFHCSKLFTFAKGGSPYKEDEMSEYDTRSDTPYIQAAVYDDQKKVFIAGMRFLPLYEGISFHMSVMNSLFIPSDEFKKTFLPYSIEIGQTFIIPDAGTIGGQSLFSVMALMIALSPDARFLFGKPTIEGRIPDISKEIVSAFAFDAFNPLDNEELNPYGKNLFSIIEGVTVPPLRSLVDIVYQYNIEIQNLKQEHPKLEYDKTMSVQRKKRITEQLLIYYGGALPPMFKFYSSLTEEKGMICLYSSVVNPVYTTKAWEFPILLDKRKIATIHKRFIDHYTAIFKTLGNIIMSSRRML